jgi:hypothetical protein
MRISSLGPAAAWALGTWLFVLSGAPQGAHASEGHPCAGNPCARESAHPCAAGSGNPCAAHPCAANPCAAHPCGAHPCGAHPCAGASVDPAKVREPADAKRHEGDPAMLRAEGERLWNDPKLGRTGLACATCHTVVGSSITQMQATFAEPYPHRVAMAADAGLDEVNAAEMVQLCMMVPMGSDPLAWDSMELAALEAYVNDLQAGFEPSDAAAHPCGATAHPCHPCGAKPHPCHPCGAPGDHPCGHPCGHPCAPR